MIMSSQGAAESPQRAPRELLRNLRAKMELKETQKSSPESLKSLENDIQIENVDVHEPARIPMKIIDFSSSEGHL